MNAPEKPWRTSRGTEPATTSFFEFELPSRRSGALKRWLKNFQTPTHMALRQSITSDSWIEDVQFALGVFSRGEPQQVSEGHMMDYLANRYVPAVAAAEFLAVQASYNWLVRNWEILGDIGLRYSGPNGSGFVNAILFSLHNEIFRDPTPSTWEKVPSLDPGPMISEAQRFIDAEKAKQPQPEE